MIAGICVMILLQLFALFGLIVLLGGVLKIEGRSVPRISLPVHIRLDPDGDVCDNCGTLLKGTNVPFVDESTRWWHPPVGYVRCRGPLSPR